jgi:hypothetical protein
MTTCTCLLHILSSSYSSKRKPALALTVSIKDFTFHIGEGSIGLEMSLRTAESSILISQGVMVGQGKWSVIVTAATETY